MEESGIIRKYDREEPPRYLSPAHWVEKKSLPGEDLKLRLVCDLRQLNKNIKRPGSSCPTSLEIWKRIKHDSKFFMVFDIASAYHQLRISKSSQDLFAFRLPQGIYYYQCAPMGTVSRRD